MRGKIRLLKAGTTFGSDEWVEVASRPGCDACLGESPSEAIYDARTSSGRWGYLCGTHFRTLGCSLGLGRGQRLVLEGEYKKVA